MFVLGVGAAKAGTTWLATYIRKHAPDYINFCKDKEQHVWDVRLPLYKDRRQIRLRQLVRRPRQLGSLTAFRLGLMQKIPAYYFYHLKRLLRDKKSITLDITPAYALLSKEDFLAIRAGVKKKGIEIKVIFLMRDPVERCISACKMREKTKRQGEGQSLLDDDKLKKHSASEESLLKADYQNTVTNLEAVFEKGELFFGLYENLFEERSIIALSDFLGIPANPAFADVYQNKSFTKMDCSESTKRLVAEKYKDTYAFCGERFPLTKQLWGGFKLLEQDEPEHRTHG